MVQKKQKIKQKLQNLKNKKKIVWKPISLNLRISYFLLKLIKIGLNTNDSY